MATTAIAQQCAINTNMYKNEAMPSLLDVAKLFEILGEISVNHITKNIVNNPTAAARMIINTNDDIFIHGKASLNTDSNSPDEKSI